MATSMARSAKVGVARSGVSTRAVSAKPSRVASTRLPMQKSLAPAQMPAQQSAVATHVSPVEVAQIAGEAGFITGTALTMGALTLVGLALGFVLLRVEALVEEGKL